MKTRKELAKSLAIARAQVTRYENKIAELDKKKADKVAKKVREVKLTDADKAPLKFGDYSDKCLVVYGGTKSRLNDFSALKAKGLCSFNPALRIGANGVKSDNAQPQGGWLFFKSKTATIADLKKLVK